jgi:hypothetical protein
MKGEIWEVYMLSEPIRVANTREHMSWSQKFALFWLALSLLLFGGAYALAEFGDMPEATRALMFIVLGTIIIINAIWQATGLALARLENLILPRRKPS